MVKLVEAQTALNTELQRSTQQAQEVVAAINGLQDVQDFIGENKTGLLPSKPTEYEPYKWQQEHASVPASQKSRMSTTPTASAASGGVAKASTLSGSGSSTINRSGGAAGGGGSPASSIAAAAAARGAATETASAASSGARKAKALYEYTASDETEISFDVDDIVIVHKVDDSGWWEGENKGRRGIFPGNYVELFVSLSLCPFCNSFIHSAIHSFCNSFRCLID